MSEPAWRDPAGFFCTSFDNREIFIERIDSKLQPVPGTFLLIKSLYPLTGFRRNQRERMRGKYIMINDFESEKRGQTLYFVYTNSIYTLPPWQR